MSAPDKPSVSDEKPVKIVKRYSNRKLYDTERSRYVTLDEIAHMKLELNDAQSVGVEIVKRAAEEPYSGGSVE